MFARLRPPVPRARPVRRLDGRLRVPPRLERAALHHGGLPGRVRTRAVRAGNARLFLSCSLLFLPAARPSGLRTVGVVLVVLVVLVVVAMGGVSSLCETVYLEKP